MAHTHSRCHSRCALQAHIWLLLAGWGFLIPCGIVIGRCLKHLDPWWFQAHRWEGARVEPAHMHEASC